MQGIIILLVAHVEFNITTMEFNNTTQSYRVLVLLNDKFVDVAISTFFKRIETELSR